MPGVQGQGVSCEVGSQNAMNKRANPKNLKCRYVGGGGLGRYHARNINKFSDNPLAVYIRQFRDRLRRQIDCRVCCRCKYAFISRGGSNVCSLCCRAAFDAFGEFTMTKPLGLLGYGVVRGWASRTGFFTYAMAYPSKYPRIPHPNLASIQSNITSTMNHMAEDIGQRMLKYYPMPRIENTRPLPHLEAINDLRCAEGRARAGRAA